MNFISDSFDFVYYLWELLLPSIGSIIFSIVTAALFGLFFIVIVVLILWKIGFFKRSKTYYNVFVKLYIPYMILVTVYISGMIGAMMEVHDILERKNDQMVSVVYENTVEPMFDTNKEKRIFIENLRAAASDLDNNKDHISVNLITSALLKKGTTARYESKGEKHAAESHGVFSDLDREIHKSIILAIILTKKDNVKITSSGTVTIEEYHSIIDGLKDMDYDKFKKELKIQMGSVLGDFMDERYSSFRFSLILFYLLLMLPIILEFLIYKQVLNKRWEKALKSEEGLTDVKS
jgi:hypothetical protein